MIPYIEIIGLKFPNVTCRVNGGSELYEDIIVTVGEIPPQAELDALIIDEEQDRRWSLIQEERDRRKLLGGYKVGTNWFHSDTFSRTQQMALVMFGANMPPDIMWKTMAGGFVAMTPTLAGQIFQTAAVSDMTLFGAAEAKNAAMLASENPSEYDYLSGWPLIYGE